MVKKKSFGKGNIYPGNRNNVEQLPWGLRKMGQIDGKVLREQVLSKWGAKFVINFLQE